MDELTTNKALLQVVESGSFSAAALEMGVSVATIARHVNSLETRLGVRLLHRTTRSLSLTEPGQIYCDQMRDLLRQFDTVKRGISSYQKDAKGLLRVHLRHSIGNQVIVPALPAFIEQYPSIKLEVTLTDEREDLVAQGIDVAVWLGNLQDSSLIARRLSPGHRMVCCSPSYVSRYGMPRSPEELTSHNCIVYRAKSYDSSWRFSRDGQTTTVEVSGNLESPSSAVLMTAVLNGLGLAMLQSTMIRPALAAGELLNVFPDYDVSSTAEDVGLFAVYPGTKQTSPKTRAFIDFLVRLFKDH
ncbi:LysR family transcriptional regulator [Paracoccus pantotrophus]|uniref:LysR family transcriptional regulator n=1 Tax=Paracoccus pantotrophus TaxID=82367 RepID=A0A7H9BQJ8_PARPN|nr:LysR family transcriptional regulator [Paracoccus pantotrophus]QLH12998.1 LysR family transcriptional regulator [Paracoccus pantotrophus]